MMKKSVAVVSLALLTVAGLGGGFYVYKAAEQGKVAAYWDGKAALNEPAEDGSLPLVKAVKAKDMVALEVLLSRKAAVDAKDKSGVSAVMASLENGDEAMFTRLAALSRADLKAPIYMKKAIDGNNAALVEALLKKGADVNAVLEFKGRKRPEDVLNYKDQRVLTPLKKAVNENKPEIVRVLAQNGGEGVADFLVENLRTASFEMVTALAENAGDLRKLSAKGMDLLTYAAGEADPKIVSYLLNKNAGDMNRALLRVLSQHHISQPLEATVEMFVKAGATPTAEALELVFKRKNTELFMKLSQCYAQPNIKIEGFGEDVFTHAVSLGVTDVAAFLLERGVDVWKVTDKGKSPIEIAINKAKQHPEMLKLLEKEIKEVDDTGYNGETLLMLFAKAGDFDNFQRMINKGANIWLKDNDGKTVLMYAAEGGNLEILDYLMTKGDNALSVDKHGRTGMMYAAAAGQAKVVKYFADRGGEIASVDRDGKAALMYAAEGGHSKIVDMLINMGESAAIVDHQGKTALMYAAEGGSLPAVETLLLKGVDVNAFDEDERSVLSYAVMGGNVEIVKRLLSKGANWLRADVDGYYPFMRALISGDAAMYRAVKPGWQDVQKQAKSDGKTVGIMAVLGGNVDLIRRVLDENKEILNVPDHEGRTFMMMLAGEGRPEVMRDGLRFRGDVGFKDKKGRNALMYAAEKSVGVNLIALLKASKEVVNAVDNEGKTALMYAVGYKENQPVKMHVLLTNGANARMVDHQGKTALMIAAANPQSAVSAKVFSELLSYADAVDARDKEGKTALMFAAANPNVSTDGIEVLLNAGADVNLTDNEGRTPLMYALLGGDMGKLRLLLASGAKTDAKTKDGKSVRDFVNQELLCFKAAAERELNL